MNTGDIVYFKETKGSVKPLGPANNFKSVKPRIALLWGDPLYVTKVAGTSVEVSAKGHLLRLPKSAVMTTPILSLYQIDCGQGDAALLHTPDNRWVMIDAGPPPSANNSPAPGIHFLWWKMFVDQSWRSEFHLPGLFKLDAVVLTHPDADHFGGFGEVVDRTKPGAFEIGTVYHNGLGRFSGEATAYDGARGFSQLGPVSGAALPDAGVTTLLDSAADIERYSKTETGRTWKLQGDYAALLKDVATRVGAGIENVRRADAALGWLPGFTPNPGSPSIRILGPVIESFQGQPGLRFLDGASPSALAKPSLTRNGHSVVLRIDYGAFRLMMTGDLNFKSQALLLQRVPPAEFACHVAKACHHGAEDISTTFLEALNPMATVFSSGDNEAYAHPRAKALALSALYGRRKLADGTNRFLGLSEPRPATPLVYSTELSRSIELFAVHSVVDAKGKRVVGANITAAARSNDRKRKPGQTQKAAQWFLAPRLVYGLINVRSDGQRVAIAVLKEDEASFQVEEFSV